MAAASVDELLELALEHHAHGRDDEAKAAYVAVLRLDATHLGALNNLGTLLFNGGFRSAARTAYRQAVEHHPGDTMARVNYGNALYERDELYQAREQYEAALAVDARCAPAHRGLAYVLDRFGDAAGARHHRDLGYRDGATVVLPYRGTGRATAVLLLVSAIGGNVDTERFLDDRRFFVTKVHAEYAGDAGFLPFHEFAFNAIGDAELSPDALDRAEALLRRTNAVVLNRPEAVRATGRAENAARLGALEGVVAPLTRTYRRSDLLHVRAPERLERAGFAFPLLLRAPGFHTGQHFLKVEAPESLAGAAAELPGESLTAIAYLDARGPDGFARKYRVMIVGGKLYPLHLAIARDWKVHYYSAQTNEYERHRDEERRFLEAMEEALGLRAVAALAAIARTLALDYAGIDFAIDARGNVMLFEANAAMMVPAPDPDPQRTYRRTAIERVLAAVDALLASARDGGAAPASPA